MRLDASRGLPLTLVAAPAGYGKSTLISHWLETSETSSAWLSLEETDNNISVFLSYLLAAVQSIFSHSFTQLGHLLEMGELHSTSVLA